MAINTKLATAALAGLLAAGFMVAGAAHAEDTAKVEKTATKAAKEKHTFKGMNSCKGNSPDGKNA